MTEEEILKHNEAINRKVATLQVQIHELTEDRDRLLKDIKPPCMFCRYDGVYRCEACQEMNYAGFNIKDFPRD